MTTYTPLYDQAFKKLIEVEGGHSKKWATTYGVDANATQSYAPKTAAKARSGTLTLAEAKAFYFEYFWRQYGLDKLGELDGAFAIGLFIHVVHGAPFDRKNDMFDMIAEFLHRNFGLDYKSARQIKTQMAQIQQMTRTQFIALRSYVVEQYPTTYAERAALVRRKFPDANVAALYARFEFERRIIMLGKVLPVIALELLSKKFELQLGLASAVRVPNPRKAQVNRDKSRKLTLTVY